MIKHKVEVATELPSCVFSQRCFSICAVDLSNHSQLQTARVVLYEVLEATRLLVKTSRYLYILCGASLVVKAIGGIGMKVRVSALYVFKGSEALNEEDLS